MGIIKQLLSILTQKERINLYLLFVAVLIMAGLEVVSVASIMPFLSVASDPSSIQDNYYLGRVFELLNFKNYQSFLIALGIAALVALVVSNTFIIFVSWLQGRYVWHRNHSISKRLLQRYLKSPYEFFLTRNSSDLSKNILEESMQVTTQMLRPALKGIAKGVVAIFIFGFLLYIDPVVASVSAIVLGGAYTIVWFSIRRKLNEIGGKRVSANQGRYRSVSEAFGGIKDIKLRGKEGVFVDNFKEPSSKYAHCRTLDHVLGKAPRYILEAIAFGGIILIAIYLIAVRGNVQEVIPTLGLYAFAGYRLMPALQNAFKGLSKAQFNRAALKVLHDEIHNLTGSRNVSKIGGSRKNRNGDTGERMELNDRLVVKDITFTYPGANQPAIQDLSLDIPAHTTVGFVGKTGSGKTTTVDIILGLLRPQEGTISIDGVPLSSENLRHWQQAIGYVPQQIYLSDDTIARNIAFGVPQQDIDLDKVKEAARRAHIYDFVNGELPDGWDTVVGERGVKLSGGQQQRIGIARALYHDPSVLVFDEATSALDQATEASVMEAIYELEGGHTMLMIAHRLSTVRRADNIIMLEDGEKVGEGSYEELEERHLKFRSMALS